MPKCKDCRFQGPYIIDNYGMRCQAPGGGPTQNPISLREACIDYPCGFFQPQEKSQLQIETIVEVEAESLEAARAQVKSQMREGMDLLAEQVLSEGKLETAKAVADTMEAAFAQAQNNIPNNANILEKKKLATSERKVIMVEALDEQSAWSSAKSQARTQFGSNAIVKSLKLAIEGSKGFLGIGKKPNQYEVELFQQAVAEVTYKTKAKIFAQIAEKKIEPEKLAIHVEGQEMVVSVDWSNYGPMTPDYANIKKIFSSPDQAIGFVIERHKDYMSDCKINWRSDGTALMAEFLSEASGILREKFVILHMPDGYLCYMAYLR